MGKPIIFNRDEIPLCPNSHGPMYMQALLTTTSVPILEAQAFCLACGHTMFDSVAGPRVNNL